MPKHSFSSLSSFERCPLQYKFSYIDKAPQIPSTALEHGQFIDDAITNYLLGRTTDLPVEVLKFKDWLDDLKAAKPHCQEFWGYDEAFRVKPYGKWVMKLDAWVLRPDTLSIIDWKTGNHYPEHEDQLELYAVGGFARFPDVEKIKSAMWYVEKERTAERLFLREEFEKMKAKWLKRASKVEQLLDVQSQEDPFLPNPGRHCKWCGFRKSGGGPCPVIDV